jgi:predicted phosphodiesterase
VTSATARTAVLFLALAGCQTPPAGWLYATRVTASSAVVAWSDHRATVRCQAPLGETVAAEITRRWRGVSTARLTGLAPGTRYRCRLAPPRGRPRTLHFRTPPLPGRPFRFAVVGDSGDLSAAAVALARRIRAGRPDFLIHVGDFAYPKGTMRQLDRRFFRPYRRVLERVPLYTTPGNHDLSSRSGYGLAFARVLDDPRAGKSYAFEWAGAQFFSLSSPDVAAADAAAARWLARELATRPHDAWRTVFLHEPPYSPGGKRITPGLRAVLPPILEGAHVDLLLAGHEHLYARSVHICDVVPDARLLEVISGGGGADLDQVVERRAGNFPVVASKTHYVRVTMSPDAVDIRAVGVDGATLDHVRRRRGASPSCRADGWPPPLER